MPRKTTDTHETTQAEPTAPQPVDDNGRVLDRFGLPMTGPARIAALAELGKPDPHVDPAAWGIAAADDTPADTETGNAGSEGA